MDLVPALIRPKSVLGIISEFPGPVEVLTGKPFSGPAGGILRAELIRVGIDVDTCTITNVWMHPIVKACKGHDWHLACCLRAVKHCKIILLLGSTACESILDQSVLDVSGLRLTSRFLKDVPIYSAPNPAALFYGPVGELRLAFEKLSKAKELRNGKEKSRKH